MFLAQETTTTVYNVTTTSSNSGIMTAYFIALFVLAIIMIVAYWKIFVKAGEAGWKSIIPFYNTYTIFRIAGRNGWWFLGLLIPIVNVIVLIILALDLAKHFGKSTLFAIFGLWLFPFIGYLMLGFGGSEYVGTKHQ